MKEIVNEIKIKVEFINNLIKDTEHIKEVSNIVYNAVLIAGNIAYVIVLIAKLTEDLKQMIEWMYPIRQQTKFLPRGRG